MESKILQVRMNEILLKKIDISVKSGLFDNRSEVVRDAVRKMYAPSLKPEIFMECMKISNEMKWGKKISMEEVEKEFLD